MAKTYYYIQYLRDYWKLSHYHEQVSAVFSTIHSTTQHI